MRVLITTYSEAFLTRGGGEQELLDVAHRLKDLDVDVDIYGHASRQLDAFDVVLHFSVHGGGCGILQAIKAAGKPVAIWPNLWMTEPPAPSHAAEIQAQLDLADAVVVKSHAEAAHLEQYFAIHKEQFAIVPAGVDPVFEIPADPEMFRTIYGVEEYLLWPGIIEPVKNQLMVIRALRNSAMPLIFIGNHRDQAYFDACKAAAPNHFKFLPLLPPRSDILRSAVQNCAALVEIPLDFPGVSALEAALAGCRLVVNDGAWSREHFGHSAFYADPTREADIREAVAAALARPGDAELKKRIRSAHLLPASLSPLVQLLRRISIGRVPSTIGGG